jgi:hypothetical protein
MKAQLVMIKMKQKIQPLIRSLTEVRKKGRKEERKKRRRKGGRKRGLEEKARWFVDMLDHKGRRIYIYIYIYIYWMGLPYTC